MVDLNIENVKFSKETFICRDNIDEELQEQLKKADILFLPKVNFRDDLPFCYPETTGEIYKFMKKELAASNICTELAISDDEYQEIELHDWWIYLPDLYIQNQIIFPMVINILSNWIYDRFIKGHASPQKPMVKFSAIVKNKDGNKKINFEGDSESFSKLIDKVKL